MYMYIICYCIAHQEVKTTASMITVLIRCVGYCKVVWGFLSSINLMGFGYKVYLKATHV